MQFTDLSENATEWNWNFGDGNTSTEQNPTHIYSTAGIFNVSLTVSNENGQRTKIRTINIKSSSPTAPYAYITNSGSNNVSVIDTATNTVTATVNVGSYPWGVAVNPDGNKGICDELKDSSTVSVIDTATNTVTATVNVGGILLMELQLTRMEQRYMWRTSGSNTVSVIDTATNTVIATVNVGYSSLRSCS